MIKVVVDLQGADREPTELAEGVLKAVATNKDLFVYLCGEGQRLKAYLKGNLYYEKRVCIVDAPEVITNEDNPVQAFQTKKNSSIVKGMELCRQDSEISAFVSCGATGAILIASMMLLGRMDSISPMLLCELRKQDGSPFCIVDCGANVDCRAEKLYDFALMGVAYMKTVGVDSPKVGLLSNGVENEKGNATVKKANRLLRQSNLSFIGNVEGNHVLDGEADVIVCEGFAGNILLKTIEGAAKAVLHECRQLSATLPDDEKRPIERMAAQLYKSYDYNRQGGAVLLGVNIPVVKGHGAADADTVYHLIELAYRLAKKQIIRKIKDEFALQ